MTQSRQNRLLEKIPAADFSALRPHLQEVTLEYRMPLYEANERIRYVYFPIKGVASLVNTMEDGASAEVGTIGNEGIIGVPIILGDIRAPTNVYIQVPGTGWRMEANTFRTALEENRHTRALMLSYVHAFFNQVAQSAACAHFHSLSQRCARWLLMTHDRVQAEEFLLTQEFLGMMLGVRRTGVSAASAQLKKLNLITYARGHVHILDRVGLERHSCECYAVGRDEYDRLLGVARGLGRATGTQRYCSVNR